MPMPPSSTVPVVAWDATHISRCGLHQSRSLRLLKHAG